MLPCIRFVLLCIVACCSCSVINAQSSDFNTSSTGVAIPIDSFNSSSSSSSSSSTGSSSTINPALILTVTLSLNLNPYVALPVNFSTELTNDLEVGLSVTADRIVLGQLGGATSSSGSASVGTSITFSVLPSDNSSLITPPQVLSSIQTQFYEGVGPLFNGTQTRRLNRAYLVVISTGAILTSSSSTGSTSSATMTMQPTSMTTIGCVIAVAWLVMTARLR